MLFFRISVLCQFSSRFHIVFLNCVFRFSVYNSWITFSEKERWILNKIGKVLYLFMTLLNLLFVLQIARNWIEKSIVQQWVVVLDMFIGCTHNFLLTFSSLWLANEALQFTFFFKHDYSPNNHKVYCNKWIEKKSFASVSHATIFILFVYGIDLSQRSLPFLLAHSRLYNRR